VMFNGGVEQMRAVAAGLDRSARDYAVSLTEYEHRDFSLLDITSPLATKGRALAWRAEQLGVERDEIMAIGDNFNDLEMLMLAGCPVVMANAVEELKTRGWRVTRGQDEAGLADAIHASRSETGRGADRVGATLSSGVRGRRRPCRRRS